MAQDTPEGPAKPDWALTSGERKARKRAENGQAPAKRRRWPLLVVLVLLLAGGTLWWRSAGTDRLTDTVAEQKAGAAETRLVMQLTPSEFMTVEPSTLRETVKVTGSLSPDRQVNISAEVSGRIEEVHVQPGDQVERGELLVQIDTTTLRNQLEQQRANAESTEAQLRLARNQLERTQNLVDRGLSPSSELESDQAQVDQLVASLAALQKQVENAEDSLEHSRIVAPFDGMVSSRSVDPGAYVSVGTSLLSLVDLSEMEVEAAVPVRYAPMLRPGLTVELVVEGTNGAQVTGTVDRINPVAVEGTRMLPVYVTIGNPDGTLRGGMFASGMVVLGEKDDAIGIPYDAVRRDDNGTYVLKIEDGVTVRQPVEIGQDWSGGRVTEITAGLEPGDVIVSQALSQLRPGTTIDFVGQQASLPAGVGTGQGGETPGTPSAVPSGQAAGQETDLAAGE